MKILAYTSPARGHLFPLVPILDELRRRDHDVVCRTLAEHLDDVRAIGIKAAAISPEVAGIAIDDWKATSPLEAQQRGMRAFARRALLMASPPGGPAAVDLDVSPPSRVCARSRTILVAARDVYSYLHLPMVAGIVLFAFGLKTTLHDLAGSPWRRPLAPARPAHSPGAVASSVHAAGSSRATSGCG
jgi:UDP:flavonoid glycosyltransferase YjiC (YdhE family)